MSSERTLGAKTIGFIQNECLNQHPAQFQACVEKTKEKWSGEVSRFCQIAAIQIPVSAPRCESQLLRVFWENPSELRQQLKGRMKRITPPSAVEFIQKAVQAFKTESDQNQTPPSPPTPPRSILWQEPLALVEEETTHAKFQFRHQEEWHPVKTKIIWVKEGERYQESVEWFYWLAPTADGNYTVYWKMQKDGNRPGPQDPHLTLKVSDGFYPPNLMLVVEEDKNVKLVLK